MIKVGQKVKVLKDRLNGADIYNGDVLQVCDVGPFSIRTQSKDGFYWGISTDNIKYLEVIDNDKNKEGGTKHDNGKPDLSLIPPAGLMEAARVLNFGADKYGRYNFMGGFKRTRLIAACFRHLYAYTWGEDKDPESGLSHLGHALCCLLMLCQIIEAGTDEDDRFKNEN